MRNTCGLGLVLGLILWTTPPADALSTDRAANLFSGDEDSIVLKTTATGKAQWMLTNDYGENIAGSSEVVDGRISIPTYGLRFGRYTFQVAGDGKVVGGLVPPLIDRSPRFARLILAAPQFHSITGQGHFKHPEEALMWKQFDVELRLEFGLDAFNPAKDKYVFNEDFEKYCQALKKYNVRSGLKFGGAQRWNGGAQHEPVNYPDYEEALKTIAAHYAPYGMDRYWVGNEPETFGWWKTTWEAYYRWLAGTTRAVKAADPRIAVNAPECWSYNPKFLNAVLTSKDATVLSVHYPGEDQSSDPRFNYYMTEMRKTGVWLPMVNGETHAGPNTFSPAGWNRFYPGVGANATGFGYGLALIGNIDFGMQKSCWMFKSDTNLFESFKPGDTVAHDGAYTVRNVTDEMAGTQMVRRLHEAPVHVVGWLFRRGSDRFVCACIGEGGLYQTMEIQTAAPHLRVVDLFGNDYTATPRDGKVHVLLTTTEVFVHGLAEGDKIAFPAITENESPELADPGAQTATVGIPFHLRLDGRDPDMVLLGNTSRQLPTYSLVNPPAGMTVRAGSGLIQWTPNTTGNVSMTAELTDTDDAKVSRTFTINVQPPSGNLNPQFVSRSTLAAIVDQPYRYEPKTLDPNGDSVTYAVTGPAGMALASSAIAWTPKATGVYPVKVTADDGKGGKAEQAFEVVVLPDPDSAYNEGLPPRPPSYLVVTNTTGGTTLVWNTQTLGDNVVQRAASPSGPWTEVAVTKETFFQDKPAEGPAFYRVLTRNMFGVSEATESVDGRIIAPLADAGRSMKPANLDPITLDGSGSFDPTGKPLTYQWTFNAAPHGAKLELSDAKSAKPTFTPSLPGRYILSLRVSNGAAQSWASYVRIYIGEKDGRELMGDAGAPQVLSLGQAVSRNAWSMPAPDNKLKWLWRRNDMPVDAYVTFAGGKATCDTQRCGFTPSAPGVYEMQFTPTDDWVVGFPDVTFVIVTPTAAAGAEKP